MAGPAVLGLTVAVVGSLSPGYDQWADTVSRLGSPGQPHALVARAGTLIYGLVVLAGARLLGEAVHGRSREVGGLIAVYGAGAVVAGLAPKDAPSAAHTLLSQVHVDATLVGGLGILVAMLLVACGASAVAERRLAAVAFVVTGSGALAFRLCWGSPVYGLVERVMIASAALWVAGLARSRTGNYS
jgi:hypothetical membrane protein